jgi:hypothetical protein
MHPHRESSVSTKCARHKSFRSFATIAFNVMACTIVQETCAQNVFDQLLALEHSDIQKLLASKPPLPWANQSEAEHHQDVSDAWWNQTARATHRRQLQQPDSMVLASFMSKTSVLCEDDLATNAGASASCTYNCDTLKAHYFPGEERTVTCFLYDAETGWPPELLGLRRTRQDAHTYVEPTSNADSVSFVIGDGSRTCTNITVITTDSLGVVISAVDSCVADGEHEHEHTVTRPHSVEVVGLAASGLQKGAGNTTKFVIGQCTDVLIRVTTTTSSSQMAVWHLDESTSDQHFRKRVFQIDAEIGTQEHASCICTRPSSIFSIITTPTPCRTLISMLHC